uniref:Uncharacterized protein n=1 Tax=Populus davidiana TaxID=266767 RepID=A0A6M2F455_9ROSI
MTWQHAFYTAFHDERGGVSESLNVEKPSSDLSPLTAFEEAIDSSSAISSSVSVTDRAPTFWLKFSILVVPGIGHTSSPWWCTQANASCDEVHCFLAAISLTRSNSCVLCSRFSGWNLGKPFLKSPSVRLSTNLGPEEKNPCPRGL